MTARRWAAWVLLTFLCIFLDTAVLRFVAAYGIRPSLVLALALGSAAAFSMQSGMVIAAVGGLVIDLVSSTTLGLTPACYIAAVLVFHALRRLPVRRAVFRYLRMLLCGFLAPAALFGASLLMGTSAPAGRTLLVAVLPSAVLTALCGMLFDAWLRAMERGQVART